MESIKEYQQLRLMNIPKGSSGAYMAVGHEGSIVIVIGSLGLNKYENMLIKNGQIETRYIKEGNSIIFLIQLGDPEDEYIKRLAISNVQYVNLVKNIKKVQIKNTVAVVGVDTLSNIVRVKRQMNIHPEFIMLIEKLSTTDTDKIEEFEIMNNRFINTYKKMSDIDIWNIAKKILLVMN